MNPNDPLRALRPDFEARHAQEAELCGAYWTWLYAERRRTGQEPTSAQKSAHHTSQAIDRNREETWCLS